MFFGSAQINVEVNIPLREMEKVALPVLQPRPDQSEEDMSIKYFNTFIK